MLSSKIRIRGDPAPPYRERPPDPRFQYDSVAVQSIAASAGRNDSGLFEVHFGDEGCLPFEGAGAMSRWRIELPMETNAFDFATISDIVLELGFTAREGCQLLSARRRERLVRHQEAGKA